MVAFVPTDTVLVAIGASVRSEPVQAAGRRLLSLVERDLPQLTEYGIRSTEPSALAEQLEDLRSILTDKRAQKNDTPLQMNGLIELMAEIRGWLARLRLLGQINLAADGPSLARVASAAPELAESYPRDLLSELERRVSAAADLKLRLEDVGLSDAFLTRGRRLVAQLRTALGEKDIDPGNLQLILRRLYLRKGQLVMSLKRLSRAGRLAFLEVPGRAALYHLEELEPLRIEPARPEMSAPATTSVVSRPLRR